MLKTENIRERHGIVVSMLGSVSDKILMFFVYGKSLYQSLVRLMSKSIRSCSVQACFAMLEPLAYVLRPTLVQVEVYCALFKFIQYKMAEKEMVD